MRPGGRRLLTLALSSALASTGLLGVASRAPAGAAALPKLTVASVTSLGVLEGNTGVASAVFTVNASATSAAPMSATFTTIDGTATAPADYLQASGTITIPAGSTSTTFTVLVVGDTMHEKDETFSVKLSSPQNAALDGATAKATIIDDDAPPAVSVGNASTPEGDGGTTTMAFPVTLSAISGLPVTVNYATANGTARSPGDYTPATSSVTVPAGASSATLTVPIVGDIVYEGNETFTTTISKPTNATIGNATGTGTIVDDDAAPVVSIADASVLEGAVGKTSMVFTVTSSAISALPVKLTAQTSDGSARAPGDYSATTNTITIPAGSTTSTFTVPVVGDTLAEDNETFTARLSNPLNATVGTATATGTIIDDDDSPVLSVASLSAPERNVGVSSMVFTVTASVVSGLPVTVAYATSNGTAAAPDDYMATTGSVTIPAGSKSAQFIVLVKGDTLYERDEAFTVTLSNPVNATLGAPTATGTITNDDTAPVVSIGWTSMTEGDSGASPMVFTITSSAVSGLPLTVSVATADGTATAPDDYFATTGSVTIPAGSTSAVFSVAIVGDTLYENNETLTATLSNPIDATIGTTSNTGTIVDNDSLPSVSISDAAALEGDAGTSAMQFTVVLSARSGLPATVAYATSNGSAKAPADYASSTGTVTIPAGASSATFTVDVQGDTLYEGDETFTVKISKPTGSTPGQITTATATIVDDDPPPSVSVADASLAEGDAGTTALVFTVTASAPSALTTKVNYATANGTALSPGDYLAANGTAVIAPGSTSATFTVPIVGDPLLEGNETFSVTLTRPVNATIARATATGTILDDDAPPLLSIADVSVAEGDAGTTAMVFTVTSSAASGLPATVDYTTADALALSPDDYLQTSGTIMIPAGSTTASFTVFVVGDTRYERDETFTVTLSNAVNAALGGFVATGTILNDDAAPPVSIGDAWVSEGNRGKADMTFTVTIPAVSALDTAVTYRTVDGSAVAPDDYDATNGSVTIPAGATSATFVVTINGDEIHEGDESFSVVLSDPVNGTLGWSAATGTIVDDDPAPVVSVAPTSVAEGDSGTTSAVFTVSLSGTNSVPVTVGYATTDGTAAAPLDYLDATGTVTIPAGGASATFSVTVVGDTLYEGNETFTVDLSAPTGGAVLGAGRSAIGTIIDDDPAPLVSVAGASVVEGDGGSTPMVFTATASEPSAVDVTIAFATSDGTATASSDYVATTGEVTIPAGETTAEFAVPVLGDTLHERNETFTVTLSDPSDAVVATSTLAGTIIDDDAPPVISVADASTTEGSGGTTEMQFTVTLSDVSGAPATVLYQTADGTATAPSDYAPSTGSVTVPTGESSATFAVPIVTDVVHEPNETFTVTISDPVDAKLGTQTATGTIVDDDAPPAFSVSDASLVEGNGGSKNMTFVVDLSAASGLSASVDYTTSDGTATAPSDYSITTGTITIAAGASSAMFTVPIVGDTLHERNETFAVTLANPTEASIATAVATGTIVDDDAAPSVTVAGASVPSGDAGSPTVATFRVTLSGVSGLPATVQYATADGSAAAPRDYTATSDTVSIPAGLTDATFTIPVSGGMPHEGNRTFTVTLSNPSDASIGSPASATGTIVDQHRLGIATGALFWNLPPDQQEAELADLEAMGAQWIRTTLFWRNVATAPGGYDWTVPDAIVDSATRHHVRIIFQVIGAPLWAVPGSHPGDISDYGTDPTVYANFVATAAQRYVAAGVVYELGNEPNHVRNGNIPNAAFYTQVLCATHAAVKAVTPDTTVLTGGIGGIKDKNGDMAATTFTTALYSAGAKGCFDGISYHPYTYPQFAPDNGTRGWTAMLTARATMVANGDGDKKIWITEYGAPTNGPDPSLTVSEAGQAQLLDIGYRLFSSYSWAGPMCWFQYQDKGIDPADRTNFMGLIRFDGSHKPTYDQFTLDATASVTSHDSNADLSASVERRERVGDSDARRVG